MSGPPPSGFEELLEELLSQAACFLRCWKRAHLHSSPLLPRVSPLASSCFLHRVGGGGGVISSTRPVTSLFPLPFTGSWRPAVCSCSERRHCLIKFLCETGGSPSTSRRRPYASHAAPQPDLWPPSCFGFLSNRAVPAHCTDRVVYESWSCTERTRLSGPDDKSRGCSST